MAGPFYFAWVEGTEYDIFDPVEHAREDDDIFEFEIEHNEGEFATLRMQVRNPRIGLLAPGRKHWAFFSWDNGSEIVLLFYGRLVGVPENLQNEIVQLNFVARPQDFAEQKRAVAETLKVRPYWDGIWFDPTTRDDPDNVLESRPELWHTDRVTLQVSSSNIITGEDGNLFFGENDIFYDSMNLRYSQTPARRVEMSASVSWDQQGSGTVDVSQKLINAFTTAGSGNSFQINSYTGLGLQASWPKAGESLGDGWTVVAGSAQIATATQGPPIQFESGYTMPGNVKPSIDPGNQSIPINPFEAFFYDALFVPHGGLVFPLIYLSPQLIVQFDANRRKTERISFSLEADMQAILTEPGDEEVIKINLSSSEVTDIVDLEAPIDKRSAVYFTTARGSQSIEYLLSLARSRLLAHARCVTISFEIAFTLAVASNLSCRKNAVLTDARFPGGIAAGKIVKYTLSCDGSSGKLSASIEIASTVGQGNSVTASNGFPTYVDEGYVDPGYQYYENQFIMPIAGEVLYESIEGLLATDDGLDLFRMTPEAVVRGVSIENPAISQRAAMPFHGQVSTTFPLGTWSQYYLVAVSSGFRPDYDPQKAIDALNNMPTRATLTLVPLGGGPFETNYELNVSQLMVPKLIDLEAA